MFSHIGNLNKIQFHRQKLHYEHKGFCKNYTFCMYHMSYSQFSWT